MARAADAIEGHPSRALAVVGVTGTNGKTTSAFLLRSVLEQAGMRCGLLGTIEARIGGVVEAVTRTTPESVDLQRYLARMRDAGDTACAMEVSSHALAQRRVAGIRFAAALFTNLTRDHLDYHVDVEDYFAAKRALFVRPDGEGDDPPGAANLDDAFGRRLAGEAGSLGYAVAAPDADVRPLALDTSRTGFTATMRTPRGPIEIASPLRGRFNVANVTGVVAVGELLEMDHAAVAAGIAAVPGVPGRFEPVDAGQPFEVLVDYAHTPDSLDNVLREARKLVPDGRRLIVVFGCGGDRDRGKRPQMGAVARGLADVAIVTSDNPRSEDPDAIIAEIVAGAQDGPAELVVEADRRAAIALAAGRAGAGDVVVIAGKGHESGQEHAGVVRPFDDREVTREVLEAIG
jgi:UDP-N-acetylmuramoyl-L-alanyl-D-glutamate--2,6-diaminopimelate ligase